MAIFNNKTENVEAPKINLVGAGTTITGNINCAGDIRIDGTLVGNITSTGKIIIGSSGKIEGEIVCANADLFGAITGNIKVHELLTLKASSLLKGDIETNKLSIEPGANFSGKCSMGAVVKDMKSNIAKPLNVEKSA
ncbi:MAG: polymer-forming cytoskeletal protein [Bacteroidia bacterium]|nr:polymer-forming cytoskeletal protein [Bacteroidia bacterium]